MARIVTLLFTLFTAICDMGGSLTMRANDFALRYGLAVVKYLTPEADAVVYSR